MCADQASPSESSGDRFPVLAARDLERRSCTLPAAFTGRWNLVLVAFQRTQQAEVDTWTAWHASVADRISDFACYEVPVLAVRWLPVRLVIDGGMAQAVRDPEVRRRTLTVYTNVARATYALDIDDTSHIAAFLVDGSGVIRWRGAGPVRSDSLAEVAALLDDRAAPDHEA
jgi:hypothetical protein